MLKKCATHATTANRLKHVSVIERYTPRSFLTFLGFLGYREYRNYPNYWKATETPREKKKVGTDEQSLILGVPSLPENHTPGLFTKVT